jgi:acetylornithine deacetylase/succinyl-diaminopimelate desuccinylase-like protein
MRRLPTPWPIALALCLQGLTLHAQPQPAAPTPLPAPYQTLGRDVLRELIETNTAPLGGTTLAAERMEARFRAAGFDAKDVQVIGPDDKHKNLVVRYRGRGARKPVLLIGHLDVVEARREDWTVDPFTLVERDGYFYGRGTLDVKGGDATLITALLRLKQEHFVPDRDLILALTADEEGGSNNGVRWLLDHHRDLIDAEYCVNVDSGGGEIRKGVRSAMDLQAAEKVYLSFSLTVHNPGGHSSLPAKDNAIYRLAAALERVSRYDFPPRLNAITRDYFEHMAEIHAGQTGEDMRAILKAPPDSAALSRLSASPFYNAMLRTTCVATQLEGGHAENALPQTARAVVNCRLLPDEDPAEVQRSLARVVADPEVAVAMLRPATSSLPSVPSAEVLQAVERATGMLWGDLPVIQYMETGATDGLYLRNAGLPVYGVSGIFHDVDDVRAHGKDERILVGAFYDGIEFLYRLIRNIASPPA